MANSKNSGYKRSVCSYPQAGSGKSYAATDHGLAHNYVVGMDNPIGGGPGDTPKRQSGRQPGVMRSPSEGDAGKPHASAERYANIGGGTGPGKIPGADRMGSSSKG